MRMKLELMDWKKVEASAENMCREHLLGIEVNEKLRALAKEEIKKKGGKTNEEERFINELKGEEKENSTAG